jgi:carbon monoxide dehydrogenase subunit G
MAHYEGTVSTMWPQDAAFDYMADARNFAEWDPGTRAVEQVGGDGPGAGAAYDVTVKVGPATMTLRYDVVEWDPPRRVVLRAEHRMLRLRDEITVRAAGDGATVDYVADIELRGPMRVLDGLLGKGFRTTGDRAAAGLRERLARASA